MALPRKYRKILTFLASVTHLQSEYHSVEACTLSLLTHVQNLSFLRSDANTQRHRGLFQWSREHIAGTGSKKILCSGSVSQNHAMRGDKIYKDPVPASIALSASPRRIFYLILLGRDRDRYSSSVAAATRGKYYYLKRCSPSVASCTVLSVVQKCRYETVK